MFDYFVWRRGIRKRRRACEPLYAVPMSADARHERATLVAMLRERPRGLRWSQLTDALVEYGAASAAWDALAGDALFAEPSREVALSEAARDIEAWESDGLQFWTILDPEYPARIRDIHEAPPFLFARGNRRDDDVAVSVVGSRDASRQGLKMARSISEALVAMDVTVVAGLAAGIDTEAHTTALEQGGRTVAMIGTGIRKSYPATNRDLQERIAGEGLLLSQFWPDAPPQKQHFPMRNAIMSGYGIATVVVEAGEHSGARIQARMAVHHGRPVILTDLVAGRTEWGKALAVQPDVYVASSTEDVAKLVGDLARRPVEFEALLSMLAV